jgi:ankyrin repeat protein
MVSLLLDRGANANAKGGRFWTTLQAAAQNDDAHDTTDIADILRMLLDHGAEINAKGGEYGTALQASCTTPNVDISRFLVEHGADIHVPWG